MNMGERIKQLRKEKGLTQEQLGKYIGVKKSAIMKYEKGSVENIKRSSIFTLSKIFNVSPSYLMGFSDDPNSNNFLDVENLSLEELNKLMNEILTAYENKFSLQYIDTFRTLLKTSNLKEDDLKSINKYIEFLSKK